MQGVFPAVPSTIQAGDGLLGTLRIDMVKLRPYFVS